MNKHRAFAVVMAFEAFRICIGQPTKKYPSPEVMRWMRCMLKVSDTPALRRSALTRPEFHH